MSCRSSMHRKRAMSSVRRESRTRASRSSRNASPRPSPLIAYWPNKITQLTAKVATKSNALSKLRQNLPKLTAPAVIATTKELIDRIEAKILSLQSHIASFEAAANAKIDGTSIDLRQQAFGLRVLIHIRRAC